VALREPWRPSHRRAEVAKTLVVIHGPLCNANDAVVQSPTRERSRRIKRWLACWHPVHHWRLRLKREVVVDVRWYRLVGEPVSPSPVVRKTRQRWGAEHLLSIESEPSPRVVSLARCIEQQRKLKAIVVVEGAWHAMPAVSVQGNALGRMLVYEEGRSSPTQQDGGP
jgi:hypothetical protein